MISWSPQTSSPILRFGSGVTAENGPLQQGLTLDPFGGELVVDDSVFASQEEQVSENVI